MKRREPVVVALLAIFTFGIYYLYWLYRVRQDINPTIRQTVKPVPPVIVLFLPLFLLLGVLIVFVIGSMVANGVEGSVVLNLSLMLLGICAILSAIIVPFWWFYRLSVGIHAYTQRQSVGFLYGFWVLLTVLSLTAVWPAIAQNEFNEYLRTQDQATT